MFRSFVEPFGLQCMPIVSTRAAFSKECILIVYVVVCALLLHLGAGRCSCKGSRGYPWNFKSEDFREFGHTQWSTGKGAPIEEHIYLLRNRSTCWGKGPSIEEKVYLLRKSSTHWGKVYLLRKRPTCWGKGLPIKSNIYLLREANTHWGKRLPDEGNVYPLKETCTCWGKRSTCWGAVLPTEENVYLLRRRCTR